MPFDVEMCPHCPGVARADCTYHAAPAARVRYFRERLHGGLAEAPHSFPARLAWRLFGHFPDLVRVTFCVRPGVMVVRVPEGVGVLEVRQYLASIAPTATEIRVVTEGEDVVW